MFKGYFAAVVTPWENAELDLAAFNKHLERLIKNNIAGVVVCGSTGESSLLSKGERTQLTKEAVSSSKKRIPVIVGVGSPDTNACIEQAKEAEQLGADAIIIACPYYVRPSQEGIYQHFKLIHDVTSRPILAYNVPSRTGVDIATNTVKRMVDTLPRLVGLKEATNNLCRIAELAKTYPVDRFQILCGNDDIGLAAFAMGACGVVSVTANVAPKECTDMYKWFFEGNYTAYSSVRNKLARLQQALFIESNPVPVKYALSLMGHMSCEVRRSLAQLADESKIEIKDAMREAGFLCRGE